MTVRNKSEVARGICADAKHICKTYGSRNAGSEGERNTAAYFSDRLVNCADSVNTQTFNVFPNAFTAWITMSVTAFILAYVAYFFAPMVALLMIIVGALPVVFEYILHKRMIDPLFKQEISQNVTAVKKCSGEVKRRLYFVANVDACYENSIKYRLGGVMQTVILVLDFIGVIYFAVLAIARWAVVGGLGTSIASGGTLYAGVAGAAFIIPLFASYFMKSSKTVADGANANLSGCLVAANVLETLKDAELENTEVGVILTGSGAVGLRGAMAWCEANGGETDRQNTLFITLNTLRELGSLNVNTREMSGSVKNDGDTVKLVLKAADAAGVKCSSRCIPFGATDSAVFSANGFKSASIVAINRKLPDYYSTRYDSYDNMSEECIAECYALALEIVREFGKENFTLGGEAGNEANSAEDTEEVKSVSDESVNSVGCANAEFNPNTDVPNSD